MPEKEQACICATLPHRFDCPKSRTLTYEQLREENERLRDELLERNGTVLRIARERDEARADLDFQNKEAERVFRGNQNRIGELCAEVKRKDDLILRCADPDFRWEMGDDLHDELLAEACRIRAARSGS